MYTDLLGFSKTVNIVYRHTYTSVNVRLRNLFKLNQANVYLTSLCNKVKG